MLAAMPRHNATLLIVPSNKYIVIENHVLFSMYFIHPLCRFRRLVKKYYRDLLNITIYTCLLCCNIISTKRRNLKSSNCMQYIKMHLSNSAICMHMCAYVRTLSVWCVKVCWQACVVTSQILTVMSADPDARACRYFLFLCVCMCVYVRVCVGACVCGCVYVYVGQ